MEERLLRLSLMQKGPRKSAFFRRVRHAIASRHAEHRGSAYSTYYEDKNEAFAATPSTDWTNKQHGVHGALSEYQPKTVLDLGSNTGWFSMLAAKLGASVVAVDLDEGSIDRLYHDARRQEMDILPLVANLTAPLAELRPRVYEDEPSLSLIGEDLPLVSQPNERLKCEMVMALALVHHLVLGQNLTFERVASILSDLSTACLCVEFVDIDDPMITGEPTFFPAYNADRASFGWYSRENFASALAVHFREIRVVPSHPVTRNLLVCRK
jgi:SAM-dependent methyltransferase